jgi:thymidylate synthase (FAD)
MKKWKEIKRMPKYEKDIPLWNAGYVKYFNHYGDDNTPLVSARMSTLNPTGVDKAKDDSLRSFLWRHGHVSPFEQAGLTIEIQVPIFIARQFMRHKSLHVNEFSQRYSEPMHEYYVPEPDYIKLDDKHNKQSSNGEAPQDVIEEFIVDAKSAGVLNKSIYEKYRRHGIAKERVRDFQPVTAYTRIMATANIRDWFFFLQKRLDAGAQMEIRDLSRAIYSILKELFPLCCEVFEEHTLKAKTFGKSELLVLRDFINNGNNNSANFKMFCDKYGLSASRARELREALDINFKH